MTNNIKLNVFDVDGTLADTTTIHKNAWQVVIDKYKINLQIDFVERVNGISTESIIQKMIEDDPSVLEMNYQQFGIEKESIAYSLLSSVKGFDYTINILKVNHKKVPQIVLSGGDRRSVIKTLKKLDLVQYFDEIICGDDDHPHKTSSVAFEKVAQKYNILASECHVFEDSDICIESACLAGCLVTDVRPYICSSQIQTSSL